MPATPVSRGVWQVFGVDLVMRDEGKGLAGFTSSACSTNAVNVIGVAVRLIVVNDVTDIRNV